MAGLFSVAPSARHWCWWEYISPASWYGGPSGTDFSSLPAWGRGDKYGAKPMKRGVKTLIAGAVVFILGVVVAPLLIVLPLILAKSNETQFKVPGIQKVTVEKPGQYYLWNDYQTLYQGRTYNRSEKVPDGMVIKITDASGTPLNLVSDVSMSETANGSSKNLIGKVEIKSPGPVTVEVSGGDEERIFSFGQSTIFKIIGRILAGVVVSMLFGIVGIGIIVWGAVKMAQPGD
jgi:hypothetical protein